MIKKLSILLLCACLMVATVPVGVFAHDENDDLTACEELLNEAANELSDYEAELIECEAALRESERASNNDDGDISLADLMRFVPGFNKLNKPLQALIISVVTLGIAYGITYIPPPGE